MSQVAAQPRLSRPAYVVIPARLDSTRLPRKMLLRETGKTLIQHTYEAVRTARRPMGVCVATDSDEIVAEVLAFGGQVRLTSPELVCGTDRVAELARVSAFAGIDIVVNVQGDEPEITGKAVDTVIEIMERHPEAAMATLAAPIRNREQLHNPACVKAVLADVSPSVGETWVGRAVYFSRAAVPHARDWAPELLRAWPPAFYQHVGVYAYRRDFLLRLSEMPPSPLESIEKLEQLRALEAGQPILVGVTDTATTGIDTPADYQSFVERIAGPLPSDAEFVA